MDCVVYFLKTYHNRLYQSIQAIVKSVRIIEEYHFLALQERCIPTALKGNTDEIVESKLEDGKCCFHPDCSNTHQIFTMRQIFEKS